MTDIAALVACDIHLWTGAIERKSGAGRGGGKRINLYGIERLRALILDLAVRGKLVPQDAGDEPAQLFLKRIGLKTARHHNPSLNLGWAESSLSDLGDFVGGMTPSKGVSRYWGDGRPWVSPKDMGDDLIVQSEDQITLAALEETSLQLVPAGSLIMVARSGILRRKFPIAITSIPCTLNQDMKALILKPGVNARYLQMMLKGFEPRVISELVKRGMTVESLIFKDFAKALWPIPPLAEQQRIVAKVDELMALCDALEQVSADAMAAHEVLVEALLATLVNSADAADLARQWARLESHLDTLFTTDASIDALKQTILELAVRGKLSSGSEASWTPKPLGAFVRDVAAGWSPKCIETPRSGTDWGVLKVSAVTWGRFQPAENKQLPPSLEPRPEIEVRPGDFLISRANTAELVARSVVVPEDAPSKLMMSDKIIRFRFNDAIDPKWVNLFHASTTARAYYARIAGGTSSSMKNVSQAQIRAARLPVPPLAEQRRIIAMVDALIALCDALKARLADAAETQRHLADAITKRAAA